MARKFSARLSILLLASVLAPRWGDFRLGAADSARQEVLEVVRQFQDAGIHGDKAALNKIFDPNITHFHPGSPYRFVGRDRLVQEFDVASNNQQDMHFEMIDPQIQEAGNDAAVATYYIVESWTDKNGERSSAKEKATEVYVKSNGRWVMIHSHYSTE